MTEIPDLSDHAYCSSRADRSLRVRAVGWLGDRVPPHRSGEVGEECRQALRYFAGAHWREDALLGCHACEICDEDPPETHGEFFVDLEGVRYVMPQMLLHYVEAHGYRPPEELLEPLAVLWRERGAELLAGNPEGRCTLPEEEQRCHEFEEEDA